MNSSPITAYEILIKNTNGEFVQEYTYCQADQEPVFSQQYCDVPMSILRSIDHYGLSLDTMV